jgi:hypothetical protein
VPVRFAFDKVALEQLRLPLFQLSKLRGVALFAIEVFTASYKRSGLSGLRFDPMAQIA